MPTFRKTVEFVLLDSGNGFGILRRSAAYIRVGVRRNDEFNKSVDHIAPLAGRVMNYY